MNPDKVKAIFDEELEYLTHARHVVDTLKTKTYYRIKFERNYLGEDSEIISLEVVAKVKAYNKQSIRLNIFAASSMTPLKGDLSGMQRKLIERALRDRGDEGKRYWELTPSERLKLIEGIEIPNLEATFDYSMFTDWSEFEAIEAPLVVGFEYVSPKFKKEYFHA